MGECEFLGRSRANISQGGLNAGSKDFGLGGGYKVTPTTMEVGMGIGISKFSRDKEDPDIITYMLLSDPSNSSANVNFKGSTNGTFELAFESTANFACVPSNSEGKYSVVCTTV